MGTNVTTKTGQIVEAIDVRGGGKYVTVAQRIQEAHRGEFVPRFQVLRSEPLLIGNVHLWQVEIEIEGKHFTGTSSINFGGKGADQTNPVENAETSALGRALGMAGFGSIESLASAEEVAEARNRAANGYVSKVPIAGELNAKTLHSELRRLSLGVEWVSTELGRRVEKLSSLSQEDVALLFSRLPGV
jgi:hypothetical protein